MSEGTIDYHSFNLGRVVGDLEASLPDFELLEGIRIKKITGQERRIVNNFFGAVAAYYFLSGDDRTRLAAANPDFYQRVEKQRKNLRKFAIF